MGHFGPKFWMKTAVFWESAKVQLSGRKMLHFAKPAGRRESATFGVINVSLLVASIVVIVAVQKCNSRGS